MNRVAKYLRFTSDQDAKPRIKASSHLVFNHHLIAEAAYYKAEKRGFTPGMADQDWAEAEAEIQSLAARE